MNTHRGLLTQLAALLLAASGASAQSVRVTGASSLRYIELRPFTRDSVAAGTTAGSELLRQLPNGRVVRCIPGDAYCYDVRPGDVKSTVPLIQDISVSVWGFSRGVRLYSQLRGRAAFGGARDLWPREDERLEVLSLYTEVERRRVKVRAGRQWRVSGLGFYNFDGAAVAVRPVASTLIEVYGGRSLVRGLNEGRSSGALEAIENLSASNTGILFGLQGKYRPHQRLALGAVYQMDVRRDRTGAYSELAAADGVFDSGWGTAESSVEVDLAGRALNHARLTLRSQPMGHATFFSEVRRYRPYFELWTIWGAFSPVGFDEGKGGLTWASTSGRLVARAEASYRRYADAGTETLDDYRMSGWGFGSGITLIPAPAWSADAAYRIESGFGASRWDGQAALRRDVAAYRPDRAAGNRVSAPLRVSARRGNGGWLWCRGLHRHRRSRPSLRVRHAVSTARRRSIDHGLEPAARERALRVGGRQRTERSVGARTLAMSRHVITLLAASLLSPLVAFAQEQADLFPHEKHARVFPVCEGCHAGIVTGVASEVFPSTMTAGCVTTARA